MTNQDYIPCYSSVIDAPPTPISPFKPHDAFFPKVDMNFRVSMKDGVAVVDFPAKHKEEAVGFMIVYFMCELFFLHYKNWCLADRQYMQWLQKSRKGFFIGLLNCFSIQKYLDW